MYTLKISIVILYYELLLLISHSVSINFDFNQNRYNVFIEGGKLENFDPNYYDYFTLVSFNTRKHGILTNLTMSYKFDVDELKVRVQLFQFLSNLYRRTAISFVVSACRALKYGYFDAEVWRTTNGNYTFCPLKKGTYKIWNYKLNATKFPPFIPEGRYKVIVSHVDNDSEKVLFTLAMYGRIENIV